MNTKKCPFCNSHTCIKKGFQEGHQRWQCHECHKKFQANKKASHNNEELFCLFVFSKQTLRELSNRYEMSTKDIQKIFDEVVIPKKIHTPREISLCVDTTFFQDFGVVVFRDQKKKEDLWWMFCEEERLEYYQQGRRYLENLGYRFVSVTGDGLPGLPNVFNGIPFQFCHFHAKKNITKYLTTRPKTEGGISLRDIMERIHEYTEVSFRSVLKEWNEKYGDFLKEKTVHPDGSWSYTHRNLRSALRSMLHMLPYLFTYQTTPHLKIPRTTNTLEGHFRHLKVRIKVHAGLSKTRKMKLIEAVLFASTASYKKGVTELLF